MRLLVSVRDASEAAVAAAAGADVIDAKDPARGALGAVSAAALDGIVQAAMPTQMVSAALGDLGVDSCGAVAAAHAARRAGVGIAKVGISCENVGRTVPDCVSIVEILSGEPRNGRHCALVLAGYADTFGGPRSRYAVVDAATACLAAGVLLDTFDKAGRSLFDLLTPDEVAAWVAAAHSAGLFVAVAGSLGERHVSMARDSGADLLGVRGAACAGGRGGTVAFDRVRAMVAAVRGDSPS
jgi:uncharacterized protein (UPF0264 family)